jgi:hypothetical protein
VCIKHISKGGGLVDEPNNGRGSDKVGALRLLLLLGFVMRGGNPLRRQEMSHSSSFATIQRHLPAFTRLGASFEITASPVMSTGV